MLKLFFLVTSLVVITQLYGCSDADEASSDAKASPGQLVWEANCKACHAFGLAGAPKIGDQIVWKDRVSKGMDVLYLHALEGFSGPAGTEMPARGGNESLTDKEVISAVNYMVDMSQ